MLIPCSKCGITFASEGKFIRHNCAETMQIIEPILKTIKALQKRVSKLEHIRKESK